MDATYAQPLIEMGVSLTQLAVKGTATAVTNKVKAIKDERSTDKLRNTYDEIVNELLAERDEAIRIAQAYRSELERIIISDEDIVHLHNTVSRVLEIVKTIQLASTIGKGEEETEKVKTQVESYEQLKELISVDTLKTMQLLGFNYKAAIGEPLTEICAKAIMNVSAKKQHSTNGNKRR